MDLHLRGTNLLRRDTATRCTVTVTHGPSTTRLIVVNDGATDPAGALTGQGTGLRGLERYLTEQDGHLTAAPSPDGTFTVEAELPTAAPVRT
jgi:two-component system, NarL family, sensor histidine kinase DesK